jgi:hypothetical protein
MLSFYNAVVDTYTRVLRDHSGKSASCTEQGGTYLKFPSGASGVQNTETAGVMYSLATIPGYVRCLQWETSG